MNNTPRRFGALSSSTDPEKLGMTVQGFIMGVGTLVIFVAGYLGIQIGTEEVTTLAVQLGSIITSLMLAFGAVRKLIVWINEKWSTRTV